MADLLCRLKARARSGSVRRSMGQDIHPVTPGRKQPGPPTWPSSLPAETGSEVKFYEGAGPPMA